MAVWNKIQIISLALGSLGKGPITSIAEAGAFGGIINAEYDLLFSAEIAKYNWRFATSIVQLAQILPVPPLNSWQYAYQLPADYLTLWEFHPRGMEYQIYQNKLLYTNATHVKIEYRFLPDESRLPDYFVDYFRSRLAANVALPITQNKKFSDDTKADAQIKLAQALATDSQSHPNQTIISNPFVNARF